MIILVFFVLRPFLSQVKWKGIDRADVSANVNRQEEFLCLIICVTAAADATEQDVLSLDLDGSTSIADLKLDPERK
ncbi:MAG: hypothetical protein M1826_006836 [Phylliscum demangeonii]|nr:MAG: hypothetical protein M1826_006836 [Phylliscum demangeonii]